MIDPRVGGSAVLLAAVLALPSAVPAQSTAAGQWPVAPVRVHAEAVGGSALLDVPFVPQSEALCGGAALAMVLRYWGERAVYAEDFAALVTDDGTGIRTTDLTAAAHGRRGMRALPFRADAAAVRAQLALHRPVIALIEDRPGVYHYVVLLAWGDGRVLYHDPAVGPHRVMAEAELLRASAAARHWALLIIPDTAVRASTPAVAPANDSSITTGDPAIDAALLAFNQKRYADAAALAERALAPADGHDPAADVLGASRFLMDDRAGALHAWNRNGTPINDLTRIDGLRRTPHAVVDDAVAIPPGALVTPDALARARRRVEALPTIVRARVDYIPIAAGTVEIETAVLERPLLPLAWPELVVHGVRALTDASVRLDLANLLRAGEAWRINAGWQENRRGFDLAMRAPGVFGLHAVASVAAGARTATFAEGVAEDAPTVREEHRHVTLGVSDWASGALRWGAGAALDDWGGRASYGRALLGLDVHSSNEQVAAGADVAGWWAPQSADAFARMRVHATVRSPRSPRGYEAFLALGAEVVSTNAPRALWGGAGTGRGAHALLRAHPLIDRTGIVRSRYWAPRLAHATLEARRWLGSIGPLQVGAAAFVDGAAVHAAAAGAGIRAGLDGAIDGGIGLRLRLPGTATTARIDAAHGLTSREAAVSIGWSSR